MCGIGGYECVRDDRGVWGGGRGVSLLVRVFGICEERGKR